MSRSSTPGSKASLDTAATGTSSSGSRRIRQAELKVWLVEEGFVTPNFPRTSSLSSRTYYPLHTAVKQNNVRIVRTLLDLGADPFCKNSAGQSPADWARQRNWRGSYSDVLALFDGLLREAKEESALLEAKDEVDPPARYP